MEFGREDRKEEGEEEKEEKEKEEEEQKGEVEEEKEEKYTGSYQSGKVPPEPRTRRGRPAATGWH